MCRELVRFTQGFSDVQGKKIVYFILRSKVPIGQKVTCMLFVFTNKPAKSDPERVRLCVGGDKLEYNGNFCTPTADLTKVKVHLNRMILTKNSF